MSDDALYKGSEKVFVSDGTVHVSMKQLEDMGIVKGTTLRIDHEKLGYDITCFLAFGLRRVHSTIK